MKKLFKLEIISLLIISCSFLNAEGFLDSIKEYSNKTIEVTKEYSSKTLKVTKEYGSKAIDKTKELTHDIATEDISFKSFYKESIEIDWVGIGLDIIAFDGESLLEDVSKNLAITFIKNFAKQMAIDSAIDYTMSYAVNTYSYKSLSQESKEMITLPIPVNKDGSVSYEEAINILKGIDKNLPLSNEKNQIVIKKAIKKLMPPTEEEFKKASDILANGPMLDILNNPDKINEADSITKRYKESKDIDKDELAKKESLLAILYFITNEYHKAKAHSNKSINLAKEVKTIYTLPAFIYATSSLYDKKIDFDNLTHDFFKYAIAKEQDNPLIPLLFGIYMDRTILRVNSGDLEPKVLKEIFNIATIETKHKEGTYTTILSRYLMLIDVTKQKIESLATTSNKTIKNSPKTLNVLKKSLNGNKELISQAETIINSFPYLEDKKIIEQFNKNKAYLSNLKSNVPKLQNLVKSLENYQKSNKEN